MTTHPRRRTEVLATGIHFGEGPRWRDGRLWFSDFFAHRVCSTSLDGVLRTEVDLGDEQPSGLGWLPDGRLLLVAMRSRQVRRVEPDGAVVLHADLSGVATHHCNDMVVDPDGVAYVGNFGEDLEAFIARHGPGALVDEPGVLPASLALVLPDGTVRAAAHGLRFPNGMVLLSDDTLVVAETFGMCLTAFDRRPDGTLTGRRTWARLGDPTAPAFPDGIAVDADDGVWVADVAAGALVRVTVGGGITDRVATTQTPYACALGGPDGRHLFALTAPAAEEAAASASTDGRVEVVELTS